MLTNNWKNFMKSFMTHTFNGGNGAVCSTQLYDVNGSKFATNLYTFKANSNTLGIQSLRLDHMDMVSVSSTKEDLGVVFGNGTTPPSESDTWISGDKITSISVSVNATPKVEDDGIVNKTITYTITNTGSGDITISEIAYIGGCYTGSSNPRFLLDHTLLDSPVTIPAGGVGQVTYTITFNIA